MASSLRETFLQLFNQITQAPDKLPIIPLDTWPEGSEEQQILAGFLTMMERVQQGKQQAIDEKEAQYRSIFESTVDGILITTLEGIIVEANPATCTLFGYTYEELLGMHYSQFTSPELHPFVARYLRRIQRGDQIQTQSIGIRKDGSAFHAEVHGIPFRYKGQPHILSAVHDITERQRAEEQLREKEAQYHSIFESTNDSFVITDLNNIIVEVNPAACKLYNYSYDELIGMNISTLLHPDFFYMIPGYVQDMHQNGLPPTHLVGRRKDGTPVHIEVQGTMFTYKGQPHLITGARDITEGVQAYQLLEQRVEERTRELSTLLEVSHNVASTLEVKRLLNLILEQVKTVVDYTGASILLLEGEHLMLSAYQGYIAEERLLHRRYPLQQDGPGRKPLIIDDVWSNTRSAQAFRDFTGSDIMESTFVGIHSWMSIPMLLKERVIGFLTVGYEEPQYYTRRHVSVVQAIANQAAIAIENARLYEQAQELAAVEERQRLARELHDSVSQALYGISLGTHTALTQLKRDPSKLADPLNYVLTLTEAALAEMRALIFELRPESLEVEGLVASLTKQAAALQARHTIAVSLDTCDEPKLSLKSKRELHRVTQEALHNIVKHAHAHAVTLQLSCTPVSVSLEIRDNGKGFEVEDSFPGHLGLRSMRERMERLGGTLQIKSQKGEGTTIRATLPM